MNVNKVILVGRLTKDPEVRTTQSGQSVVALGMATNNYWTDKGGTKQERTEFHNVVLWGRLAEIAGQYLTKGQECFIEGRLQSREYTAKDGSQKRVTEIVGENMQLGSRAQGSTAGAPRAGGAATGGTGSYVGAGQNQPKSPVEEEIPTINLDDEKEEIKIEDVPF
jgi:single-strand DNA-binding protein